MPRTDPLDAKSTLLTAILSLFHEAAKAPTVRGFLQASLSHICQCLGYDYAAVVEHHKGNWQPVASFGAPRPLPDAAASDALDRGEIVSQSGWLLGPLSSSATSNFVFGAFRLHPAPIDDAQQRIW